MAQLLLERNADIEARDKDNRTPLHDAAHGNSTEVAKLLLERNADIKARDKYNRTPYKVAHSRNKNINIGGRYNETLIRLLMKGATDLS